MSEDRRSLRERLNAAERRIAEHPGYAEHREVQALGQTIIAVFMPNRAELLELLERAATDWQLAIELVQNVREPVVAEKFQALVTQRLHNYVASSNTLVDHVRRVMRDRTGPIVDEFERRKSEVIGHREVLFISDLRNFTLHRKLPLLAHSVSVSRLPTPTMESEVELNVGALLAWERWSEPARSFIEASGEAFPIRPVIRKHGDLVYALNSWLVNELSRANAGALDEVNELVIQRNAILTGGDLEAARRIATWDFEG